MNHHQMSFLLYALPSSWLHVRCRYLALLQAALASDPTGGRWAKGLYRLAVSLEANLRYREAYEVAKRAARFVRPHHTFPRPTITSTQGLRH